jgi:hypothetical protein
MNATGRNGDIPVPPDDLVVARLASSSKADAMYWMPQELLRTSISETFR